MATKIKSPAETLSENKPRRKLRVKTYTRKFPWLCRITELRHKLRISLDDVAKEVGISKTALWQIEHGTDPMLTTAKKLAAFFGKVIEDIWRKP